MKKRITATLAALALVIGGIAVPPVEAQAAQVSVSSAVSPSAQYQVFYISTDDPANTRYDLYNNNTGTYDVEGATLDGSELRIYEPDIDYTIYVYQIDSEGMIIGSTEVSSRSSLAHEYTVSYELYDTNGSLVTTLPAEEGVVAMDDSFIFSAESIIEENGIEYDLSSDYAQLPVHYGVDNYTFQYEMYDPEDIEAYIYYVDDRGNVLDTKSLPLSYYGGDETFTVDQHITVDGREYTKFSGPDTITVNYFSPVLDYDIVYVEDEPAVTFPYSIKINYVDSNGMPLGTQYETITAEDGEYDIIEIGVPDSLEISTDGTVSYYHTDQTVINHDPNGSERTYNVTYNLFDQESPYYWDVRLVDSVSGSLLGEQLIEVGVGETVSFVPESMITVDGTDYVLDDAMASSYERHYDDQNSRIQYIYYNEVGAVVPDVQTLNISFLSVSDNTVLDEQTVEVPAGEDYTIDIPETFETEDTSYVRLAGQGDALVHDAGTPQSSYTIYYRDVNDLQNVDTTVIQEETIYYDVPVTEEEIIYVDEVAEAPEAPVTVVANAETGETDTYNAEGELITPDAQENEAEVEEIEEPEAPTANIQENNDSETADNDTSDNVEIIEDQEAPKANVDLEQNTGVNPVVIAIIIAAAAVVVIAYVVIVKKRKDSNRK
jgi:hypothetical protein